jgi:hypothetical protein
MTGKDSLFARKVENPMQEVKIKADKYGQAISLLLEMGGGFQTRFERTLIVNAQQRRVLEEADCVATSVGPRPFNSGRRRKGREE